MKVILEHSANAELVAAAEYYNEHQSGLGSDFLDKVDVALDQIAADPLRFGFYRGSKIVRSIRLARFPYRLFVRRWGKPRIGCRRGASAPAP